MAKTKKTDVTTPTVEGSEKEQPLSSEEKKTKRAQLLAKAKQLEGTVTEDKKVNLKKQVKGEGEEEEPANTLVPMEDYLKSSIHLGTRVITPDMRPYVYRRRADGLAVFNTALLDEKMRAGIAYLNQFAPGDIILVCKREAGWKAVKKFAELTGIRVFTKKYPAGVLTNTNLETFFETKLVFICDSWLDKNALEDARRVHVPVFSVCDTNNFTKNITQVLPGNNKSAKSLGMMFFLLAKYYCEHHKIPANVQVQDFIDNWDSLTPPK